ncbi:hypothetical protein [Azovibrio restrictus]|uniref:hypothetical protein n=1 Tax=Azovibrio restrictus TaxID=146938 RepID=UPI0026F27880|nr:hypothetical protein [Azovibrio restrictus]
MLSLLAQFVGILAIIVGFATHPWLVLAVGAAIVALTWISRAKTSSPPAPARSDLMSANGLPALNEDWVGEEVLSIDDDRIPPAIREHGARFRNPARYAIAVSAHEYLLYGGDGELLDLCWLK